MRPALHSVLGYVFIGFVIHRRGHVQLHSRWTSELFKDENGEDDYDCYGTKQVLRTNYTEYYTIIYFVYR